MENLKFIFVIGVATLLTSVLSLEDELKDAVFCAYSKESSVKISLSSLADENGSKSNLYGTITDDNSTQICAKGSENCYALWKEESLDNVTSLVVLSQGCWGTNLETSCNNYDCVSKKKPKALNNTKFCCCSGNMCNSNFTDGYIPGEDDAVIPVVAPSSVQEATYTTGAVVVVLATVVSLAIVAIAAVIICRMCTSKRKPNPESLMHLMESPPPNSYSFPQMDLDTLKLQEFVGRGRFGSVSKGTLLDHDVAVKVFAAQNRNYFLSERDIYTLPFMDHPCLPKYIGSQERLNADGFPEYLLVLSYAPKGCLQDYLRQNTVDWTHLCKMTQSITNGLAHLHTEIRRNDKIKPCIAHRDLNSRNILVKSDLSCEICDFGFAIRISGSKYFQHGEEQVAETTSLADVGTLRYMAPEVLEGAVNLRDCETSLKQIDIYALGLVMWEIATRCSDLYQGMETPGYKLPFEAEIGLHPSMEQMQVLVTRNKARPLFPDIWKATNPAVRQLKETIDDCWDQDAEARLTALCVEERLIELPSLWERFKVGNSVTGVSPTVNVNLTTYNIRPTVLDNLTSMLMDGSSTDKNNYIYEGNRDNRNSVAVSESTAETILTNSPSDAPPLQMNHQIGNGHVKNNTNRNMTPGVNNFPAITVPLQPHQGRNPCLERNLMMECSDDMSISGNNLLERSDKNKDFRFLLSNDVFDGVNFSENIESNLLVSSDLNSNARPNYHPIPYVQNAVHGPIASVNAVPKRPNLPGNGRRGGADDAGTSSKGAKEKKGFGFFGIRSYLGRKSKKSKASDSLCEEDQRPLKSGSPTNDGSPTAVPSYLPVHQTPNSFGHSLNYASAEGSEGSGSKGKSNLRQSDKLNFDSSANRKLSPVVTKVCVVNDNDTEEVVVVSPAAGLSTSNDFGNGPPSIPHYGSPHCKDSFQNNALKAQSLIRNEFREGSSRSGANNEYGMAGPPLSVSVPIAPRSSNLSANQNQAPSESGNASCPLDV